MSRRHWLWILVAIVALGCGPVWAQERLDEMIDLIEEQLPDDDERDDFLEGVEDYIEVRDAALERLVQLAASPDEGELRAQWDAVVDAMLDLPELDDLDDDLTSGAALALYNTFVDQERAWFLALSQINPLAYRDAMVQSRIRLSTMTQLLEEKWQGFLNDDGLLDQQEKAVTDQLSTMFVDMAQKIDGSRQLARSYIDAAAQIAGNDMVGDMFIPGPLGDAVNILSQAVTYLNTWKAAVDSAKVQLTDLAGREIAILVLFNETRRDTQLFVEQNNLDRMKELYGDAEDELESFVGVGTSGQRDDAGDFVDLLEGVLSRHVSAGETIFNDFVTKHRGKFFGPVGPDIAEALTETQVWLAEAGEVDRMDLDQLLRAWRDDANAFFGVSLSIDGITDEEREFIEEHLEDDLDALKRAIDDNVTVFSNENFALLFDRRKLTEAIR